MNKEIKTFLLNLLSILLALEIRAFFDKGGSNNDLAFTLLKILVLVFVCVCAANMEEVTRIVINSRESETKCDDTRGVLSLTKILRATKTIK